MSRPIEFTPPKMPRMFEMLRGVQQPQAGAELPLPYPDVAPTPETAATAPAPTAPQPNRLLAAATAPPQAPVAAPPQNRLMAAMGGQAPQPPVDHSESTGLTAQVQAMNKPPGTRESLLKAVTAFAPTLIAGMTGGLTAAAGAAQGVSKELGDQKAEELQQRQSLLQQVEAAKGREERMGERQLTTQERANEADLRRLEIEGTNASRLEGIRQNNEVKDRLGKLSNDMKEATNGSKNVIAFRKLGLSPDGTPIPREQLTPAEQSKLDLNDSVEQLHAAQEDHARAQAELTRAGNDPNSPKFKQAQERLTITAQRLALSQQQTEARLFGTNKGEALPGSMIGDDGKPVGTAFQQNVRPTGAERNKADLANSAHEQIQDMKSIVQAHPEIFGPAAGRTTDFTVWMGSQDPDAQRFRAARTIAGDHLAGVFGGRSEAALSAIDSAIGHFKDNPAAVLSGLDQLDKANVGFQKAGTVKTTGSNAARPPLPGATPKVGDTKQFANGKTGTWDGKGWVSQ